MFHRTRISHSHHKTPRLCYSLNSSWPSATYMRRDFQCLFPQRPRYVALISVLISPVPHIWGVTNGSLLASPPNSRRSPASLISPAPHICGASRTPIVTRVVWKILNVVTKILVVLPVQSSINCSCWNKWEHLHHLLLSRPFYRKLPNTIVGRNGSRIVFFLPKIELSIKLTPNKICSDGYTVFLLGWG